MPPSSCFYGLGATHLHAHYVSRPRSKSLFVLGPGANPSFVCAPGANPLFTCPRCETDQQPVSPRAIRVHCVFTAQQPHTPHYVSWPGSISLFVYGLGADPLRTWPRKSDTVGTRLSESRLSKFSIIRTLGRRHVFGSSGKKTFCHWSSATGESKAAV